MPIISQKDNVTNFSLSELEKFIDGKVSAKFLSNLESRLIVLVKDATESSKQEIFKDVEHRIKDISSNTKFASNTEHLLTRVEFANAMGLLEKHLEQIDRRLDEQKENTDRRFDEQREYTEKRLEQIDKRIDEQREDTKYLFEQMNKRFDEQREYTMNILNEQRENAKNLLEQINKRFNTTQWMISVFFGAIMLMTTLLKLLA